MLCELLSTTIFDKKGTDNYTKANENENRTTQVVMRNNESKHQPTPSMYINDSASKQIRVN